MMSHLSPQEFVDAVDRGLTAARQSHLDACEACRCEVDALREALGEARQIDDVPEPSPLFWDHMARRVREVTQALPAPAPRRWWSPLWQPLAAVAATAAIAALVIGFRPDPNPPATPDAAVADLDADLFSIDDGSVEVMTALAGELTWEQVQETSLAPRQATVDLAVTRLTDAQRLEMMRILREEMGGSE